MGASLSKTACFPWQKLNRDTSASLLQRGIHISHTHTGLATTECMCSTGQVSNDGYDQHD